MELSCVALDPRAFYSKSVSGFVFFFLEIKKYIYKIWAPIRV